MPTYKFTYFNARAKGETIRLLFAEGGIPYEDVRIEKAQWPALKPTTPFGQVPILEIDGHKVCQSNAIARCLARKIGLAGKTDNDQMRADMIVDCIDDTLKPAEKFYFEQDAAKKEELKKKYVEEQLPVFLTNLEKMLSENHGGGGFFVADSATWADFAWTTAADRLTVMGGKDQLAKHPKLQAVCDRVLKMPKIAEWVAKRPHTDF